MPPTSRSKPRDGSDTFRVLLTGFGPFLNYPVNPAWQCVVPLSDVTIPAQGGHGYKIHITVFQMPVTYQGILDIVPLIHARPPQIPPCESSLPPPEDGYDFIMHCGVAGGASIISLELKGHKSGYALVDAAGEFPPATAGIGSDMEDVSAKGPRSQRFFPTSLKSPAGHRLPKPVKGVWRGFPEGYEDAPLEVTNDRLDLTALEQHLGLKGFKPVVVSDDAGLYCCDYLAYCSMHHSQETTKKTGDGSPVLFMHIPTFGGVYSQERITRCIRDTLEWACENAKLKRFR